MPDHEQQENHFLIQAQQLATSMIEQAHRHYQEAMQAKSSAMAEIERLHAHRTSLVADALDQLRRRTADEIRETWIRNAAQQLERLGLPRSDVAAILDLRS